MQPFEEMQKEVTRVLGNAIKNYTLNTTEYGVCVYPDLAINDDTYLIEKMQEAKMAFYATKGCLVITKVAGLEKATIRREIGRGKLDLSKESDRTTICKLLLSGIDISFNNGATFTVRDIEAISVLLAAGFVVDSKKVAYVMYS